MDNRRYLIVSFLTGTLQSRAIATTNDAVFHAALLTFLFNKVCHFMMAKYTSQQRVEIIKIYYRSSQSVASTLRALRLIYGRNNRTSRSIIENRPIYGRNNRPSRSTIGKNLNPQAQYKI